MPWCQYQVLEEDSRVACGGYVASREAGGYEGERASVKSVLKRERKPGPLQNSLGRNKELLGKKWLLSHQPLDLFGELLGPAVMCVSKYQGQPITCCSKILSRTTVGASSATSVLVDRSSLYSSRRGGTL